MDMRTLTVNAAAMREALDHVIGRSAVIEIDKLYAMLNSAEARGEAAGYQHGLTEGMQFEGEAWDNGYDFGFNVAATGQAHPDEQPATPAQWDTPVVEEVKATDDDYVAKEPIGEWSDGGKVWTGLPAMQEQRALAPGETQFRRFEG